MKESERIWKNLEEFEGIWGNLREIGRFETENNLKEYKGIWDNLEESERFCDNWEILKVSVRFKNDLNRTQKFERIWKKWKECEKSERIQKHPE